MKYSVVFIWALIGLALRGDIILYVYLWQHLIGMWEIHSPLWESVQEERERERERERNCDSCEKFITFALILTPFAVTFVIKTRLYYFAIPNFFL
jgi:hypothetical protein